LKRGLTDSDTLWKWFQEVSEGQIKRKTVNVIVLDHEGNRKTDWRFVDAYPVKWAGPDFKADSAQIAIESLELVHEGIKRNS
jgi:phage tail-like protein